MYNNIYKREWFTTRCLSSSIIVFHCLMKQATVYYVAFHIAFISFRLFAFERECIKQQKHKNKLLYMMVQPTIFNVSFQCHLYSICTMLQ